MNNLAKKTILFIDDDEDDYLLMRDIFKECHKNIDLQWLEDGEKALDWLKRFDSLEDSQRPVLIFLDLNMPKLNGREVLRQIRSAQNLQHIPVIVLTNSMNKQEAIDTYRLGVNSFIRKPAGYQELTDFVKTVYKYWFEYSTLV